MVRLVLKLLVEERVGLDGLLDQRYVARGESLTLSGTMVGVRSVGRCVKVRLLLRWQQVVHGSANDITDSARRADGQLD